MVSALGASIVFQNAVMLIYGARVYVYPENLIPTLTFNIFGLNVPLMRVIVIVSSLVLMLALYALINRTRMGTAIRAVAIDQGAARLMGINVDRVISLVFFIGAGARAASPGLWWARTTGRSTLRWAGPTASRRSPRPSSAASGTSPEP